MGRQPYLTRLALGRSAFELPSEGSFPAYNEDTDGPLSDDPNAAPGEYIQLYDRAGRPVNPRSQQLGRRLRAAQNDVFAAFGVVQHKAQEAADLEEDEGDVEAEELAADTIAAFTHSSAHISTWWLVVLKAKIMGLAVPSSQPLTDLIESEYKQYGNSLFLRGLSTSVIFNLFGNIFNNELSYGRLLAQFLIWTKPSRKRKQALLSTIGWGSKLFSFIVDISLLPVGYYSMLEILGLTSTTYFPPMAALFTPGSPFCPWPKLFIPKTISPEAWCSFFITLLVSPAAVLLVAPRLNRLFHHAIRSYLPSYSDINTRLLQPRSWGDHGNGKGKTDFTLILKDDRPLLTRSLSFLGWGFALSPVQTSSKAPEVEATLRAADGASSDSQPTSESESRQATSTTPPEPSTPTTHRNPVATVQDILADEASTELPLSPRPHHHSPHHNPSHSDRVDIPNHRRHDGNESSSDDSRTSIRITTREPGTLTVELEIDSSETGPAPEPRATGGHHHTEVVLANLKPHRVTRLSKGPSRFLADVLSMELASFIDLPFRLISFRFCALYFAETKLGLLRGERAPSSALHHVGFWKAQLTGYGFGDAAVFTSRIIFCTAASMAVDLVVWGVNYGLTKAVGMAHHQWGEL